MTIIHIRYMTKSMWTVLNIFCVRKHRARLITIFWCGGTEMANSPDLNSVEHHFKELENEIPDGYSCSASKLLFWWNEHEFPQKYSKGLC